MIVGGVVLITAILGMCLTRARNKICLSICYGLLAFLIGTALIIFGVLTIAAK